MARTPPAAIPPPFRTARTLMTALQASVEFSSEVSNVINMRPSQPISALRINRMRQLLVQMEAFVDLCDTRRPPEPLT